MSLNPLEIYIFTKAAEQTSKKYHFVEQLKENATKRSEPITCLKNGLRFLELNCSLLYGFTGESFENVENEIIKHIPAAFDSALVLPLLLDSGINPLIITNLQSLLTNDQRETGFWNYFLRDDSRPFDIIPDDIDDTSCVLMSLYLGQAMSKDECIQIAENMRKHFSFDNNGLLATFFKPGNQKPRKVLAVHYLESPRIDIGSCLNCFWLFGSLGLDHILREEEFQPTMNLISSALEQIERNEEPITHARYYPNSNVLLFLLSRFVMVSKYGKELFRDKLAEIIKRRLESNNEFEKNKSETVIDLACQIMAAINMNLHSEGNNGKAKTYILLKMKRMISLQLQDGSFPRAPIYQWTPYNLFAGSKAITTAFAVCAIKMVLDFDPSVSEDV